MAQRRLATYGYDPDGKLATKDLENGTSTVYTYDDAARLTEVKHLHDATLLAKFDYVLDSVGNRTQKDINGAIPNRTENYAYDAVDQVVSADYGPRAESFEYDAAGNRVTVVDSASGTTDYTANALNQYTSVGATTCVYDSNGNLSNYAPWTYIYDAGNRLTSVNDGTTTSAFGYDSLNRQVSRTINGAMTYLIYDGWNLIAEYDSSGSLKTKYIHGGRADEILTKIDSSGAAVYYHHDGLGSTVALTSAAGALLESYRYDAFGKPTVYDASGSPIVATAHGNRFLFAGREYIAELKLYDSRNRFYSPELGRFLQTDPLRFGAGDANIYRYVGNNPQNATDPLGLCEEDNPLGFGRPPGFVDDLTKSLLDESGNGGGGDTAIDRAQELPLDTTYRDTGEGDSDGIYITHYGPSERSGGWDPDGDSGADAGRGAVDPETGEYIQINDDSLAISKNVADENGLNLHDPVYVNGQYLGNYDDRAPEPGRIDVYDPNNAVNQTYWGGMFWGATVSNRP